MTHLSQLLPQEPRAFVVGLRLASQCHRVLVSPSSPCGRGQRDPPKVCSRPSSPSLPLPYSSFYEGAKCARPVPVAGGRQGEEGGLYLRAEMREAIANVLVLPHARRGRRRVAACDIRSVHRSCLGGGAASRRRKRGERGQQQHKCRYGRPCRDECCLGIRGAGAGGLRTPHSRLGFSGRIFPSSRSASRSTVEWHAERWYDCSG